MWIEGTRLYSTASNSPGLTTGEASDKPRLQGIVEDTCLALL